MRVRSSKNPLLVIQQDLILAPGEDNSLTLALGKKWFCFCQNVVCVSQQRGEEGFPLQTPHACTPAVQGLLF